MRSSYERNREELESVLKRVARSYAQGEISKEQFDDFARAMEASFQMLDEMKEDTDGQAEVHSASGQSR